MRIMGQRVDIFLSRIDAEFLCFRARFGYHVFCEVRVMSIERFFLINQLMNFTILAIASRGMAAFRPGRVFLGSILASSFAMLPSSCHAPPVQFGLLLLLAGCIAPRQTAASLLTAALSLAMCAALSGSLCLAFSRGFNASTPLLGALGAFATMLHKRIRAGTSTLRPMELIVENAGGSARLHAIVDTGNRLHEPFSGQPVLIAEARALQGILPERGFRAVRYASVGGGGLLRCFRPDGIYILSKGRPRQAPEVWIALYPARLPGGMSALAPAEYAL